MTLLISNEKQVQDLQHQFSARYPFLKLEFYRSVKTDPALPVRKYLQPSTVLKAAGLTTPGMLEVNDEMTVVELESSLLKNFGLIAQVSRKCGMLWIETTMTNKWTLQKQNEHGREISLTSIDSPPYRPDSEAV